MPTFVILAHNEEAGLGRCIDAVRAAAAAAGVEPEIVVVDDASTDRTAPIARARGARVVSVVARNIAAARNAGAHASRGRWLFFVDADTLVSAEALAAALHALRTGASGGGCLFRFDEPRPGWLRLAEPVVRGLMRLLRVSGGCFLFCRRADFEAVGGFDERFFAIEDRLFMVALKRRGRFVVPRPAVLTSGRQARHLTLWQALALVARMALGGPGAFRDRGSAWAWYGGPASPPPRERSKES